MSSVSSSAAVKGLAPAQLETFAASLFTAVGMDADKAASVARFLILTDCMGRRTHGLAMAPAYLADIAKGGMALTGEPEVVRDTGATAVWDGRYLPGLWLMDKAVDQAVKRAATYGVATMAIRRSHHIGCLAALVKQAADKGFVAIIQNSEPAARRVAPYGGVEPLFTPNPMAIGYPTTGEPVLVDICASITTTSMTRQKHAAGELFAHEWLLDGAGQPTRDPAVLEHGSPAGSLQLMGGQEYGHKGFGLALGIEALSQGLSGQGRADKPARWGGNVFLQVLDPEFFAGAEAFTRQTGFFADQCRGSKPLDPRAPVRIPGDQAARSIVQAARDGLSYDQDAWQRISACAEKLNIDLPESALTA